MHPPRWKRSSIRLTSGEGMSQAALHRLAYAHGFDGQGTVSRLIEQRLVVPYETKGGIKYLDGEAHRTLLAEIVRTVGDFHQREPLSSGMSREELRTRLPAKPEAELLAACLTELTAQSLIHTDKD